MRPSRDNYFLAMARVVSTRSTCLRRSVGCVLVNKRGHVLATGYNGVASGLPHCNEDEPCKGAYEKSGTNLDACEALHAEQNALLQCSHIYEIETCYCTVSPCIGCTKLLMGTSCRRIVFLEEYPHYEARYLWFKSAPGRSWEWLV